MLIKETNMDKDEINWSSQYNPITNKLHEKGLTSLGGSRSATSTMQRPRSSIRSSTSLIISHTLLYPITLPHIGITNSKIHRIDMSIFITMWRLHIKFINYWQRSKKLSLRKIIDRVRDGPMNTKLNIRLIKDMEMLTFRDNILMWWIPRTPSLVTNVVINIKIINTAMKSLSKANRYLGKSIYIN